MSPHQVSLRNLPSSSLQKLFIYSYILSHKSLSYFPTFLATHSCPISLLLEFILASHLSEMETPDCRTYILFFKFIYFILFIYGCVGSSFLCEGFLQLRRAGTTLHRGARASHYRGLSCSGAQAPDAQAQQLWLTGLVAPQHVGSSRTRAQTCVPCIGRWILNHCATREVPLKIFLHIILLSSALDK